MNQLKGEIPLKVGNKEYKLKFTTNSMCALEELLGVGISQIIAKSAEIILPLTQIRAMLYCACMEYHVEEVPDLKTAGGIIDLAGHTEAWIAVVKAIASSLPDREEGEKKTQGQVE